MPSSCVAFLSVLSIFSGATPDFGPAYALLQQLEEDYVEAAESGVPERFDAQLPVAQRLRDAAPGFPEAVELEKGILAHAAAISLRPSFLSLRAKLEKLARFPLAPASAPSLAQGKALYAAACAACHGADGSKLKQESFQSSDTMNPMSPWRGYVAITWGVWGTAMPAFETLNGEERWAIAFYVQALRQPSCTAIAPKVSLAERATSTDAELYNRYSEAALPCLRRDN